MIAVYPTTGIPPYKIQGTVSSAALLAYCSNSNVSSKRHGPASAYAVNIVNGHFYSGLVDCGGGFRINILKAGSYRLFAAVPIREAETVSIDQTGWSPSWYINNTTSTNDPIAGTVLTISQGTPSLTGIQISMLQVNTPFAMGGSGPPANQYSDSNGNNFPLQFNATFLSPGESGIFETADACNLASGANPVTTRCAVITSIQTYGTALDYALSFVNSANSGVGTSTETHVYQVTVTANVGAEEGHRLVIARSAAGNILAGPIRIHILRSATKPSFSYSPYLDQFRGMVDYRNFNFNFWK